MSLGEIQSKMSNTWKDLKFSKIESRSGLDFDQHKNISKKLGTLLFPIIKEITIDIRNSFFERRKLEQAESLTREMFNVNKK